MVFHPLGRRNGLAHRDVSAIGLVVEHGSTLRDVHDDVDSYRWLSTVEAPFNVHSVLAIGHNRSVHFLGQRVRPCGMRGPKTLVTMRSKLGDQTERRW
jgi:hypothetical protein